MYRTQKKSYYCERYWLFRINNIIDAFLVDYVHIVDNVVNLHNGNNRLDKRIVLTANC